MKQLVQFAAPMPLMTGDSMNKKPNKKPNIKHFRPLRLGAHHEQCHPILQPSQPDIAAI
jgi:hypothetical protein